MDKEIMRAIEEQDRWQKEIDKWKQRLQNTSQEQDKGRTRVLAPVVLKGHVVIVTGIFLPLAL